jgi:hypothetical protein
MSTYMSVWPLVYIDTSLLSIVHITFHLHPASVQNEASVEMS